MGSRGLKARKLCDVKEGDRPCPDGHLQVNVTVFLLFTKRTEKNVKELKRPYK